MGQCSSSSRPCLHAATGLQGSHALGRKQSRAACGARCQLEVHPPPETPAKGHFDISGCCGAPAEPRKQRLECTMNQPCTRAARAVMCIGRKPAHSVVDGVVCMRCQQRSSSTEISCSLGGDMPEHVVPAVGHWAAPRTAHMDAR